MIKDAAFKYDLPEKNEPLRLVPFISKRCFVPCGVGRCNCYPTVGHHFCIVFESQLNKCSQEFLREISFLQEQVEKSLQKIDLVETDQSDVIDETHTALRLASGR